MKTFSSLIFIIGLLIFTNLIIGQEKFISKDIMPVELIYFFAEPLDSSILVKWGTATEVSNFGFEVQRRQNQDDFAVIDFVPGNGNSFAPKHYIFEDTTIEFAGHYYYRLKQIDTNGDFKYSDTIEVDFLTYLEESNCAGIEVSFSLSQNYPNPFNPSTTIDVSLRERGEIVLRVYDLPGNLIYEKNYGEQFAGKYKITLDAKNWSSGIYIYQVITGEYVSSKPMILLK